MTHSPDLTDTQLVLLTRAAQREDGLLVVPDTLRGSAARGGASKLQRLGLVVEVPVGANDPHWSRDDGAGLWLGLQVTKAGLAAIGMGEDDAEGSGSPPPSSEAGPTAGPDHGTAEAPQARSGTKRDLVISLLTRPEGAALGELTAATGWLPHTTRAALTGLRQKGFSISRRKDGSGQTVYRIEGPPKPSGAESSMIADTPSETV